MILFIDSRKLNSVSAIDVYKSTLDPPRSKMFRFAHKLKFMFMDAFLIKMRMDLVMAMIDDGKIEKAVFLLDCTLMHMQNVLSDVYQPWRDTVEAEILSLMMLLMVNVTSKEQIVPHVYKIDDLLRCNEWYGDNARWANVMARRLTSEGMDVGVLSSLPQDITWRIAQEIMA